MGRQNWEYCAIVGIRRKTGMRSLGGRYPAIWYFRLGVEIVEIKGDEGAQLGKAIFQLGQDGWEMVGAVPEEADAYTLYFKRPI